MSRVRQRKTIGQTMKEVGDGGYKYLGILELDKLKEREITYSEQGT